MKKVAILQSNYIPWKGYFDIIGMVDEFVLYDDVQYTRRDWRNRNKIKTANGLIWLTVPVDSKGKYEELIQNIRVSEKSWAKTHWNSIRHNYTKANYFSWCSDWLEELYLRAAGEEGLSSINHLFIMEICKKLDIQTKITWSSDYAADGNRSEKLLEICLNAGADCYLSGPAAKSYLDESIFAARGITVEWMKYSGYPEYEQLFPPFEHGVSIVDLFMNVGPDAHKYMRFSQQHIFGLIKRS